MNNWSTYTPNYQTLPQKRKRTNECLLDNSEELEHKRCHTGTDSVVELHKEYIDLQDNMSETCSSQGLVSDESVGSSKDPFPVIHMLLSRDKNRDNYTLTVTDTQLANLNPLKELYFSTNNQLLCDEQQRSTHGHTLKTAEWHIYENTPTYEIVPYTAENDIKRNPFWLQSYSEENDNYTTSHTSSTKDAMELE
ncbi:hypothetical protein Gasu2_22960 [Galdieria sulphuraria]|uniref:Uncharacterized protein n=1 Tax=Galdieria sulphuraria TaxID=130081 RepID=M2Y1N7_GALSU|nr:uncharacterized protein Gasu_29470 [Galdieria sulphuraria]EME29729.1 hypothetical protein Gasu_29470 [Galdieria sulphuraria]GJD07978.1 hypothetical protein Gasu2_22960 [Galdieria sulphuraria]|eukprot:XP_005706249.1 hypothetical protein Gasu_29470 [Galdieria sulphuraria]